MKVSWNWLGDWVDLEGLDPHEVADKLTMLGLETEGVEITGQGFDHIVVGHIEVIEPHPDSDKLVICRVNVGQDALKQIVCGAKNMKAGDKVPAALEGAKPPAFDFVIADRKLRGVMSEGMLCSEDELGLAKDTDGLMILPPDLVTGQDLVTALALKDTVIEISLTPNRPDCLGHRGVAREIAAAYNRELKPLSDAQALWESKDGGFEASEASLSIEDLDGCPRYIFSLIKNVEVGPSPLWLASRLRATGLRSINNIVDITNYILMDLGQPIHAFDYKKLSGQQIVVRRAREGEVMIGLDQKEYKLTTDDLVIADSEKPVAIAGVMGGANSEVDEQTTEVLLEVAYFDPSSVRKSAKHHSLHTEASHRFERGIDSGATVENAKRAVEMIASTQSAAKVGTGIAQAGAAEVAKGKISITTEKSNRALGLCLTADDQIKMWESIGLTVSSKQESSVEMEIPTWRPDLERPIDLVEEIARLYGFDQIPSTLPKMMMGFSHQVSEEAKHKPTIFSRVKRSQLGVLRQRLLDHGFHEAINYSFMSPEELDSLELSPEDMRHDLVEVANPLTVDQKYMRTTLLWGLLRNYKRNKAQRMENVSLFELGRVYYGSRPERRTLAFVVEGKNIQYWQESRDWNFYDLKGLIAGMWRERLSDDRWEACEVNEPYLHPGVQARYLTADGGVLATLGQLHPKFAKEHGVDPGLYYGEVDLEPWLLMGQRERKYQGLKRFPAIKRDYAYLLKDEHSYNALVAQIHVWAERESAFGELMEDVELFDHYQGEQVPEGHRSLALSIRYRAEDRTLTDEQITAVDAGLSGWLNETLGAIQR